jgi:hypothetical protein
MAVSIQFANSRRWVALAITKCKLHLEEGQIMKKGILSILVVFVLWVPCMIYAEDAMRGEVMLPSPVVSEEPPLDYGPPAYFIPASTRPQAPSTSFPKEWHIIEKIPSAKGLAIGVFLFEEGMPIEHIRSVFGKPEEIIALEMEEGFYGTILVYPHHHFFFSKTGNLQNIKERNLQTAPTVK